MITLSSVRSLPLVLLALCLAAQTRPEPAPAAVALPVQHIGSNDLIAIAVYGSPDLTRTVRVDPDGFIQIPMLKERIAVAGLLPGQVEAAVAAALTRADLILEPAVTVQIVELHSRPVSVSGAVRRPLTFQAVGRVTLLDALNRAEGLSPEAGAEILVSQTKPGPDGKIPALIRRIPIKRLIDEADPEMNFLLSGGEEIRVPEVGKVFVIGNVRKPGAYRVTSDDDATVLKTLALAEGLAPYAAKQAYVYRRDRSGGKQEIAIALKKILSREAPDVPLAADDILYIPDNTNRRLTAAALEKIIGFGASTVSGVLIWGVAR
jgi:polysaccharide export outer membrane protein